MSDHPVTYSERRHLQIKCDLLTLFTACLTVMEGDVMPCGFTDFEARNIKLMIRSLSEELQTRLDDVNLELKDMP